MQCKHMDFQINSNVQIRKELYSAFSVIHELRCTTTPPTKACYVQHSDVVSRTLKGETLVDSPHNVVEETGVQGFGQGIPRTAGLVWLQRDTGRNRSVLEG